MWGSWAQVGGEIMSKAENWEGNSASIKRGVAWISTEVGPAGPKGTAPGDARGS